MITGIGFNKKILESLNIDFTIENSTDFSMFKQLAANDIRELLSDNYALQQSILRQITSLDDLVILSVEMSEPKLRVIFETLGSQLKNRYVKTGREKTGLIMTFDANLEKSRLLIEFFDINIYDVRLDAIHPEMVKLLLAKPGIKLNENINPQDNGLLMWALNNKHFTIAEDLIRNSNVNVNLQNSRGDTALMQAIQQNRVELIEALLQRKDIDVNLQNSRGDTALMLAVDKIHPEMVERLLTKPGIKLNENINSQDNGLLMWALNKGHFKIAKI
jgi:hypothetical protein